MITRTDTDLEADMREIPSKPTDALVSLTILRETDTLLGQVLQLLEEQRATATRVRRERLASMASRIERVRHGLAIASAGSGAG